MKTIHTRHPRISGSAALISAVTLALALTGCASSGSDEADNSNAAAKLSEVDIPNFTVALSSSPQGFDWATSANPVTTGSFMALVTEPIERINPDGSYSPVIATKVTQSNPTTLVYTIRSEVTFSDGQPLTAEDVAWSISHAATPPASTSTSLGMINGAKATGPLEVTVTLAAPVPTGRDYVADILIQQRKFGQSHASDLGSESAIPVGTGPYTVTSTSSSGLTLTRRDEYWGTMPKVETVDLKTITDDNAATLAMRSGDIDLRQIANVKGLDQWEGIAGTTIYRADANTVDFLAMDTSKAPFNDVHVRKAIAYATDVDGFIKGAYSGEATALKTFLPVDNLVSVAGSKKAANDFADSLPQHEFDIDKAKKELAQSSHPDGFSTTVEYIDSQPAMKLMALSLQQNLKPLGVDIKVKATTLNAWGAKFFQHQLTGLNLAFGFSMSTRDASSLLGSVVGQSNIGPQKQNTANYSTPEIEKALPTLMSAAPNDQRWQSAQTLLSDIAENVPYVPLSELKAIYVMRPGYGSASGDITLVDMMDGRWILNVRAAEKN